MLELIVVQRITPVDPKMEIVRLSRHFLAMPARALSADAKSFHNQRRGEDESGDFQVHYRALLHPRCRERNRALGCPGVGGDGMNAVYGRERNSKFECDIRGRHFIFER